MGAEIVPGETIPAETGIADVAVDFKKGCYPGQELVERMDCRGAEAPSAAAHRSTSPPAPSRATRSSVEGAEVGMMTSVGGTRALGYVKRGVDLGTHRHAMSVSAGDDAG